MYNEFDCRKNINIQSNGCRSCTPDNLDAQCAAWIYKNTPLVYSPSFYNTVRDLMLAGF